MITSRLLRARLLAKVAAVPVAMGAALLAADHAYQSPAPVCAPGQPSVATAREHIPGVAAVLDRLQAAPPPLHLAAARFAPDHALSALAKANGLPSALARLPATRSGSWCLVLPGAGATVAPASTGRLRPVQVAAVARAAGFSGPALVKAVAVALAESGGKPKARCFNTGHGCGPARGARSTDRGLWQVNDRAWPDVATTCADEPACAARAAWRISKHGRDWRPWSSYKSGSWLRHLDVAMAAVERV